MTLAACGSATPNSGFELGVDAGATDGGGGGPDDGSGPSFVAGDGGSPATCVNLQCSQVTCPAGKTTSLSGRVVTGGAATYGPPDPVYNAIIYVPNTKPDPFKAGVTCDKCGTPATGNPIATALSGFDGTFTLPNIPVGVDIPLVIQVGRWRRQIVVPKVSTACTDTALTAEQTRLPRNQQEGDIPLHAIASSTFDPEECILRKMGVDDAEFTSPDKPGRVHLYTSSGAQAATKTDSSQLWADLQTLLKYDIVLFPCNSLPGGSDPTPVFKLIVDYTSAGGRMFATDLSYPWIESAPAPFPQTVQWTTWRGTTDPLPAKVDTSFPKGTALANWLQAIGATTTLGDITLHETYHVVTAVNAPTSRWLYSDAPATLQTFSFNTPVGVDDKSQCGRVAYSNFHIASGTGAGMTYPAECPPGPLTPQEKVMEFMLLDLASCVQTDTVPPEPPPPVK
jgi:hypothetical protein